MMMKKTAKNSSFLYYTIPLSEDIKATIRALQYKKRSEPRYLSALAPLRPPLNGLCHIRISFQLSVISTDLFTYGLSSQY